MTEEKHNKEVDAVPKLGGTSSRLAELLTANIPNNLGTDHPQKRKLLTKEETKWATAEIYWARKESNVKKFRESLASGPLSSLEKFREAMKPLGYAADDERLSQKQWLKLRKAAKQYILNNNGSNSRDLARDLRGLNESKIPLTGGTFMR